MYIKSLELHDFGPHAGSRTYEFPERGVIGLIGENGNGKSHIMDAIRLLLLDRFDKPLCYVVHGYGLTSRGDSFIDSAKVVGTFCINGVDMTISKSYKLDKLDDDVRGKMAEAVKFAEVKTSASMKMGEEVMRGSKKVADRVLELLGAPAAVLDDTLFVRQKNTNAVFKMLASARKDALFKLSGAFRMMHAGEIASALQKNLSTIDRSAELDAAQQRVSKLEEEIAALREIPEVAESLFAAAKADLAELERRRTEEDALAQQRAEQLQALAASEASMQELGNVYQRLTRDMEALPAVDDAEIKRLSDTLASVEATDRLFQQREVVRLQQQTEREKCDALWGQLSQLNSGDPQVREARIEQLRTFLASSTAAAQVYRSYKQAADTADAAQDAWRKFDEGTNPPVPPTEPKCSRDRLEGGKKALAMDRAALQAIETYLSSLEETGECSQCHSKPVNTAATIAEQQAKRETLLKEVATKEHAVNQFSAAWSEYDRALAAYQRAVDSRAARLRVLEEQAKAAGDAVRAYDPIPTPVDEAAVVSSRSEFEALTKLQAQITAVTAEFEQHRLAHDALAKQLEGMAAASPVDPESLRKYHEDLLRLQSDKARRDDLGLQIRDAVTAYNTRKQAYEEAKGRKIAELPAQTVTQESVASMRLYVAKMEQERDAYSRASGEITAKEEMLAISVEDVKRLAIFQEQTRIAKKKASFLADVILLCRRDGFPSALSSGYVRRLNVKMEHVSSAMAAPFTLSLSNAFEFVAKKGAVSEPYFQLSGGQETLAAWIWHLGRYELHSGSIKMMCLDEPTDGLDKKNMDRVADQLATLGTYCAATGLQTLIITHEESLRKGFTRTITIGGTA